MKMIPVLVMAAFFAMCRIPDCNADTGFIGTVKTVTPEVFCIRQGQTLSAFPHMKIMTGDVVRTGQNGKVGFILKDDTVISLGPDSKIVITNFAFDPAGKNLSLIARFYYGTIAYLSGQIVKLSPESVQFETPVATIGIRGTRFLARIDKTDQE